MSKAGLACTRPSGRCLRLHQPPNLNGGKLSQSEGPSFKAIEKLQQRAMRVHALQESNERALQVWERCLSQSAHNSQYRIEAEDEKKGQA